MSANYEYLVGMLDSMGENAHIYGDPNEAVYNGHIVQVEPVWDRDLHCGSTKWKVDGIEMTYGEALIKLADL